MNKSDSLTRNHRRSGLSLSSASSSVGFPRSVCFLSTFAHTQNVSHGVALLHFSNTSFYSPCPVRDDSQKNEDFGFDDVSSFVAPGSIVGAAVSSFRSFLSFIS